jgi:L-ascorbate metabolism protein UlaG (beta-lactamase superfamily)
MRSAATPITEKLLAPLPMRLRPIVPLIVCLPLFACPRSSESPTPPEPASAAPTATPAPPPPSAAPSATAAKPPTERQVDVLKTSLGDVRIVPIHHGSVLFELGDKAYYVDPFHEGNFDGLPKAEFIFITHAHPDHLDPIAIEKIEKPTTVFVCPPSVAEQLPVDPSSGRRGGPSTVVLKNGDKQTVGGLGVEAVPMYNLKRGPAPGKLFHEKGWGDAFVLTFGDKRVYLSGDTECTPEMRALKNIDVAFVCMNLPYTMPPSEAAECIAAFKPAIVYPYHYRGSDLSELDKGLAGTKGVEVRKREWY